MSSHQNDKNKKADTFYDHGKLDYLVVNNKCRLLDGRRTEGYIEEIFIEKACFRWRISNYEDKGKFWDVDLEDIVNYQFEKHSKLASSKQLSDYNKKINEYNKEMNINIVEKQKQESLEEIKQIADEIKIWLLNQVDSIKDIQIDLTSNEANKNLTELIKTYMKLIDCEELESNTVNQLLLNPNSGEWFKGNLICMAEMGLTNYQGKIIRDKTTFKGIGKKELRKKYILHRLAFIRAVFDLNNMTSLVLYRGMSSEKAWKNKKRSILHMTLKKEVAEEFASLKSSSKYINSYIVKMTIPVESVFITFIETDILNERYRENEVLIIVEDEYWL